MTIDDIDLTEVELTEEKNPDRLTLFEQRLADRFLVHGQKARAYREAGGPSENFQTQCGIAAAALNRPHVQDYIAERRAWYADKGKYDQERAMVEAERAMDFAKKIGNPGAYVKAVELRAKLQGLLIEKHQHLIGSFSIKIKGIDDMPPNEPTPIPLPILVTEETK